MKNQKIINIPGLRQLIALQPLDNNDKVLPPTIPHYPADASKALRALIPLDKMPEIARESYGWKKAILKALGTK